MKKLYYESPTVEVVDVRVEGGFGLSDFPGEANITDYNSYDAGDMESVDSY